MNTVLLGIIAYLVIQFVVGMAVSRRIKTENDYLLAGRRLGLGLAAFSIFATWFGAESIVGAAGNIYEHGLSGGSADPFGYAFALIAMGMLFAIPLWRAQYTTFGDLFAHRYSRGVERTVVLLLIPTSVMWAAAQIRAFGQVVGAVSGIDISWALMVAAALVIVYTMAGGLLADVLTDFVQSIGIILGLTFLAYALWQSVGEQLPFPSEQLRLFDNANSPWWTTLETWAVPICGSVLSQELIARILGCRSADIARRAALLGGGLYLLVGLIPVWIGLWGPTLLPGLIEPEQLVATLAEKYLPPVLYVAFIGALVSAILSTVDSALLASAALIEHNLVLPLKPHLSEKNKLRLARGAVILMGIISYILATHAEGVFELVETASAFGSAGVFVVALFGLFTRIGDARHAYAALAAGMLVWAWGKYIGEWDTPYIIALISALLSYLAMELARILLASCTRNRHI